MPKNGFIFGYVIDVISFLSTDLEEKKTTKKEQGEKEKVKKKLTKCRVTNACNYDLTKPP